MADKKEFSLETCTATNSRAGGSGVSMAPNGFLEAFLGEQTGCKGSATKTKGEETADQTTMTKMAVDQKALAEKAEMPAAADETAEQQEQEEEDFDKLLEKAKAEYAQLMDNLFGGDQPNVKWVKYPSYMSYPGMEADMEADGLKFDDEVER